MSQHLFSTTHNGKTVTVLLGWDRPLQHVFMVIDSPESAEDDITYSNLLDANSEGQSLDYYEAKLAELGIKVPEVLFQQVHRDVGFNAGNRYCVYQADGSFTDTDRKQASEPLPAVLFENFSPVHRSELHAKGAESLKVLFEVAQGNSGQCKYIAGFLACLYNGYRFNFDLTDFRCLDSTLFEHCISVLRMDHHPQQEVHNYFKNGGQRWEKMIADWGLKDQQEARAKRILAQN